MRRGPLRLLVCDDDPAARAAVRIVAEAGGHVVLAETDQAGAAIDLIERFSPDAVILDIVLRFGTGTEVIDAIAQRAEPCPVVVFTAFGQDLTAHGSVVAVVDKPDFDRLATLLADLPATAVGADRRAWISRHTDAPRPAGAVSDPAGEFYATLAAARPGDTLVVARPHRGDDLADLAVAVRATLRAQDWLLAQPTYLVLLVVGGNPDSAQTVQGRLPNWCDTVVAVITPGEDPLETLRRLTPPAVPVGRLRVAAGLPPEG